MVGGLFYESASYLDRTFDGRTQLFNLQLRHGNFSVCFAKRADWLLSSSLDSKWRSYKHSQIHKKIWIIIISCQNYLLLFEYNTWNKFYQYSQANWQIACFIRTLYTGLIAPLWFWSCRSRSYTLLFHLNFDFDRHRLCHKSIQHLHILYPTFPYAPPSTFMSWLEKDKAWSQ